MIEDCSCRELASFYRGVFEKLLEDILEAYLRTPITVSSRPYVERALRLVQAALSKSIEAYRLCGGGR